MFSFFMLVLLAIVIRFLPAHLAYQSSQDILLVDKKKTFAIKPMWVAV